MNPYRNWKTMNNTAAMPPYFRQAFGAVRTRISWEAYVAMKKWRRTHPWPKYDPDEVCIAGLVINTKTGVVRKWTG